MSDADTHDSSFEESVKTFLIFGLSSDVSKVSEVDYIPSISIGAPMEDPTSNRTEHKSDNEANFTWSCFYFHESVSHHDRQTLGRGSVR